MPRRARKKKMYRKITEHHKEDIAGEGAWNSFAYLRKDPNLKSAYADSVRISFLVDDRNAEGGTDSESLFSNMGFGLMFAASYQSSLETVDGEANQLNPDSLVSVTAKPGMAGVVTLPIKHVIRENIVDLREKDGYVYLWMKAPDSTTDDHLIVRMFIESYGRWHELIAL